MAEEKSITRSEEIAADIRRLKRKRCGVNHAIDALEVFLVEALLLESGYSPDEAAKIILLYENHETMTEE